MESLRILFSARNAQERRRRNSMLTWMAVVFLVVMLLLALASLAVYYVVSRNGTAPQVESSGETTGIGSEGMISVAKCQEMIENARSEIAAECQQRIKNARSAVCKEIRDELGPLLE